MKDKNVAAILALFLGGIGVHKFYLGRLGAGFFYLIFSFTFIPAMLGLIDFFILALMDNDEFNRRFNGSNMIAPVVVNMLPPAGYPPPAGFPPGAYPGYGGGYPPAGAYGHTAGHPGYGGAAQPGGYPSAPTGAPHGAAHGAPHGAPHGAAHGVGAPSPGGLTPDELAQKLEKLNELRISGLLTEEEFQAQKAKLLHQM